MTLHPWQLQATQFNWSYFSRKTRPDFLSCRRNFQILHIRSLCLITIIDNWRPGCLCYFSHLIELPQSLIFTLPKDFHPIRLNFHLLRTPIHAPGCKNLSRRCRCNLSKELNSVLVQLLYPHRSRGISTAPMIEDSCFIRHIAPTQSTKFRLQESSRSTASGCPSLFFLNLMRSHCYPVGLPKRNSLRKYYLSSCRPYCNLLANQFEDFTVWWYCSWSVWCPLYLDWSRASTVLREQFPGHRFCCWFPPTIWFFRYIRFFFTSP